MSREPRSDQRAAARLRWVLASLSLCMLLPSLGISSANVALPALAQAFAAPFQQVQWVVAAYLLANTALVVGAGTLGDRLGRRRLLVAGLAIFAAASALCSVAPTLWLLVAARALQGVGAALLMALAMAFVGDAVPKQQTGRAMGLLGTTSAVGTALGPTLGGLLIEGFGWRAIFFVNVPLTLLALLLAWRWLPADRPAVAAQGADDAKASPLLQAFAFRHEALRDPQLRAGMATSALVSTVMMATLVVGPFYLKGALGLEMALVGLVMSAGPAMSALAGVPAGRLVDRHGARRMTFAGLLGMGVGCVALISVPAAWGIAGYVGTIVLLTAHYALFQAANNTAVMTGVSARERGAVSGLLALARNLGLVCGASLMGGVFAFATGAEALAAAQPDAVAKGMRSTFLLAAGLVGAALAVQRTLAPAPGRAAARAG